MKINSQFVAEGLMSHRDVSSRQAVLDAIAEYDRLGKGKFLARYGYKPACEYFLIHNGREYDSKAIVGVAYGYQYPQEGLLAHDRFSGGYKTVQPLLESLGFEVQVRK